MLLNCQGTGPNLGWGNQWHSRTKFFQLNFYETLGLVSLYFTTLPLCIKHRTFTFAIINSNNCKTKLVRCEKS